MSLVRATEGFVIAGDDDSTQPRIVKGGEVLKGDDPVVKACSEMFEAADVETATQSPGERRNVEIPVGEDGEVDCPVEGCDYSGSERGLKIHRSRSHDDGEG